MGVCARKDLSLMEIINISSSYMSANSYLLVDSDTNEAAVVDPGGDAPRIIYAIQSNAVRVTAILLTHGHYDHILALDEIKAYTHAPVYIHRLDNCCLQNPAFSLMGFIGRDDTFDDADVLLEDGDTVCIGNSTVTVMHTPGHTAGSVCYITDAGVISGDTLFYESVGRTDFPGGSFATLSSSIRALYAREGDEIVYPGHGQTTSLSHERICNPFVQQNTEL